jgi:branched-chain amino acid transport system permease protein
MVTLAFGMSAGIGAMAGCVVAPLTQTHYAIGSELAIKGFTVAAFGGLGNSVAAVVAGLFMGMLESFSIILIPEAYKDVVTILVLLAVLFLKPSGLFGSRTAGALKEY